MKVMEYSGAFFEAASRRLRHEVWDDLRSD